MKKDLIQLGYTKPELRPHLRRILAHFDRTASDHEEIRGSERNKIAGEVFELVAKTYAKIGVPVSRPSDLMKYSTWYVHFIDDKPVVATLFKDTPYGLKVGLAAFDGSSEGKQIQIRNIKTMFNRPNLYGEVSHKVEKIAISSGAPVVPAKLAGQILGKPIEILDDEMHYERSISGVGKVKKVMVGNPKTSGLKTALEIEDADDEFEDRDAHIWCVSSDDWD